MKTITDYTVIVRKGCFEYKEVVSAHAVALLYAEKMFNEGAWEVTITKQTKPHD